ncbi:hypothetical protein B0A55_09637 [Friedmanniomyces simplex]|uniref:DFDF domain-containing protein n=1 Tax=Friedmanniomyces simplex TaxID=329884 RepID=A0A4U0WTQ9_9PEZI|nr:hypothetical protein B0A55_09637 [Friedmanniomyces simplex]
MSEYIGSRIALISKSDIKYIGTLHEINSESHTVALESVTSYGTEGRKGNPAEEIAGSEHVYEYIVFRGSDVKELNIVAPPGDAAQENRRPAVPDDPAILGSARPVPPPQQQQQHQQPPPQHQQNQFRGPPPPPYQQQQHFGYPPPNQFQQQPRFQGPGGPHGFPGAPGAVPGYGMGPPPPGYGGMGYGPPGPGFQGPPPPGHFPPNQQMPIGPPGQQQMNQQRPPPHMQQGPPQQQQQPPMGSKQGTPQPDAQQLAKPPGLQLPESQRPIEMSGTPAPSAVAASTPAGPPPPIDSKPTAAAATAPAAKPVPKANSRVALPLASSNVLAAKPPQRPAQASQPAQAQQPPPAQAPPAQPRSVQDATQAATAAVAAAMAKLGAANTNQQSAVDNLTQKVNQMRVQGGPSEPPNRARGRGRGGQGQRGGRRESQPKAIEVPKEDYDFESANAKFNKEDLVKERIASGSPMGSPAAHGGQNGDASPMENGHGREEDEEVKMPGATAADKGYNKKSSFFDDISSDLKDRTEAAASGGHYVDGRAMRREERSRNMETFGQGSVDGGGGYRGGFRGRGRGRGFGRGGGGGRGLGGRGGLEGRGGGMRGRGRGDGEYGVQTAGPV